MGSIKATISRFVFYNKKKRSLLYTIEPLYPSTSVLSGKKLMHPSNLERGLTVHLMIKFFFEKRIKLMKKVHYFFQVVSMNHG